MRWFSFISIFFIAILASFWGFAWIHRVDFVQDALQHLYPDNTISVGSVDISADGRLTIHNTLCGSKKYPLFSPMKIHTIALQTPLSTWMTWLIAPHSSRLTLHSVHIIADRPIPKKILDSLHDACTIKSLTTQVSAA